MKQKSKAIISFILSLILCFSFFPSTVYAADYNNLNGVCSVSAGPTQSPTNITRYDVVKYPSTAVSNYRWSGIGYWNVYYATNISAVANDTITFELNTSFLLGSYDVGFDFPCYITIRGENKTGEEVYVTSNPSNDDPKNYSYDGDNEMFYCQVTVPEDLDNLFFSVSFVPSEVSSANSNLGFTFNSLHINVESEQTGFFNSVKEFFQELFEKLTSAFDNIGAWFSELGDKIKSFFTDLTDNIKSFFSDLSGNLKEWFNNIGDWFTEIGDKISGFFEKLWNRIWWGNENGESEYQKPVIDNKLNDILDTLDDYQLQLKNTIDTIGSSADEVSTYISTGTQLVNGVIGVAGVGFTALIVFGIVFVLVRKVVGR